MLHLATPHQHQEDDRPYDRHSDRSKTTEAVGEKGEHFVCVLSPLTTGAVVNRSLRSQK